MANSEKLQITELDFDGIKDNLKQFLRAQSEFKDYDFEGSGMSSLLDVLAYNTHYLGFNANMLANEMFLDSAALRSSISSHAKTLGYTPTSARAATAVVNVALNTSDTSATMPAGTVFNATINEDSYQFITIADVTKTLTGSTILFSDTDIYEGSWITTRYSVDSTNVEQRFVINDNRADTSTLRVKVQTSLSDSTTTTYTLATDIALLTSTSTVYFLQEVEAGKYEVYFGDGILSKAVTDGNIIILEYVVTNKTLGNGGSTFTNAATISGVSSVTVTTVSDSVGGAEPESPRSIKLNAPLDYASQGRCVTTEDYKTYVKQLFPNTQAVSVWGGESGSYTAADGVVDTAEYGKVFISVKSTTGRNLNEVQKETLVSDLAPYTVASITPVVVDPETLYLILVVNFKYDSSATTKTVESLETLIDTTISNYNESNLKTFVDVFRYSKMVYAVDNTDTSIVSNSINITMAKYFTPTTTGSYSYKLNFSNAFYNPHSGHNADGGGITASTGFYVSGNTNEMFFDDDGEENLRIYYLVAGVRTYYSSTAGTINYSEGSISISPIYINAVSNVDDASSTQIRLTVIPNSHDIVPVRNTILEIDTVNSTVSGAIDTIETSDASGTSTYVATSAYPSTPSSF